MDRAGAIFGFAVFAIVGGMTWCSSIRSEKADVEGAVAEAIKAHFEEWIIADSLAANTSDIKPFTLCVESNSALNIHEVSRRLSRTIIAPVAASECTSKTVEGDFGMFTAMTYYFDRSGVEAAQIEIVDVRCASSRLCVVDIDDFGAGIRYQIKKSGSQWRLDRRNLRWIV